MNHPGAPYPRWAYFSSDNGRTVQIARFVVSRTQAADITDAQCRSAWGMSTEQWATLKNKMRAVVQADQQVRAAMGE